MQRAETIDTSIMNELVDITNEVFNIVAEAKV